MSGKANHYASTGEGMSIRGYLFPPHFDETSEFREARDFRNTLEPGDGIDYDWVWGYAKELHERQAKIYTTLDDKADAVIRYLGGGVGLLALGTLAAARVGDGKLLLWLLPTVVLALLSIVFAVRARRPGAAPGLPKVNQAIDHANKYSEKAKATFLGQLHVLCEGLRMTCVRKARLLTVATWLYLLSLATLALPIVAVIVARW
jgi:hypothetical protein